MRHLDEDVHRAMKAGASGFLPRILGKLDLRDRLQAVVLAYESGIVRPGA